MSDIEQSYPIPQPLTSSQRAKLRSMASSMTAIIQIGKGSMTPAIEKTVSDALEARELIKISVLETCELTPAECAETLSAACRALTVSVIGRKVILFRRPLNKKNRRIEF